MPEEKQKPKEGLEELLAGKLSKLSEDLTYPTTTGLTSSAIATFIMSGFAPQLVAEEVINVLIKDPADKFPEIIIPYATNLTAGLVAEDGSLAIQSGVHYGNETLTLAMYGVYDATTWELKTHSNIDLIADRLVRMGRALAVVADELIVSGFNTATPTDNSKKNYTALGADKFATWDDIFKVVKTMVVAKLRPRVFLTNPTIWMRLVKSSPVQIPISDTEIKYPYSVNIAGFKLLASHLVADKTIYVIDRDNCGYLMREPMSSHTMKESGSLVEDIWAYLFMGCKIVQEETVQRIMEDTA